MKSMTIGEIQSYLASLPPTPNIHIIDYQDILVVTNKELESQKRLAEEKRLFEHFINTGEVLPTKLENFNTSRKTHFPTIRTSHEQTF